MTMPSAVRQANEIRARHCLLMHHSMSRADLARELELTRATASSIVANLIEAGQVIEIAEDVPSKNTRTGRPSIQIALNPDHAMHLGAYIGADHLSLCAVDFAGRQRHFTEQRLNEDERNPEQITDSLARMVDDFASSVADPAILAGLNVAVPGIVTLDGTILRAPPLNWGRIPLQKILSERIDTVAIDMLLNDANAFAFAAQKQLENDSLSNAVFVLLEDGIGGCLLSDGHLVLGHEGLAGEIGHIPVGDKGFVNLSGIDGALENFFARRSVLARYGQRGGTADSLTEFLAHLDGGVPLAQEVLSECIGFFARGLAMATALLNPEAIIVGGRASLLVEHGIEDLQERLSRQLVTSTTCPQIILSDVGREGPAVGAALKQHEMAHGLPVPA